MRVMGDRSCCEFPIDFACFHSPFYRLVMKSFCWLVLQDVKRAVTGSDVNNHATDEHQSDCSAAEKALIKELAPYIDEADRSIFNLPFVKFVFFFSWMV